MYSKLTSLCYKIIPWYYLVSLALTIFFFPKNYNEPFATTNILTLTEFFTMVLIFPILEELYIRYWLYGKNNYFRIGFMFSFVLSVCITIYNILSTSVHNYAILFGITAIGLMISFYLQGKKYNVDTIISFINSFNRSWITVVVMSFYFTMYHINSLNDFNWRFIIAYSFLPFTTIIARKYGIIASILIHMIHNTETANRILIIENAGVVYYYATLFLSISLIVIYMKYERQLDKNKHQHKL
jgi:membrane protease YdiL (CAAX protease family)